VLLIEDDEADVFLVKEILARGRRPDLPDFEIIVASTLAEGLLGLADKNPDLVLLDLMLPDSRGIDSLRAVASKAGTIPIVVLSGVSDEHLSMEAARYGAQDFLVKGHVETMWLSRIMRYALARRPPGSFVEKSPN
jgi:DNA-binding response OmpR family regulator